MTQPQSIPQEKFLLIAANLLHRTFVDTPRTTAKGVYRDLMSGRPVYLTTVQMEDKSTVPFHLALEHAEYCGKLSYGAFRSSVAVLINNIMQQLQEKKPVKVFTAAQNADNLVFGVTAVTVNDERPNVMMLGADVSGSNGAMLLRLSYFDPEQFRAETGVAGDGSSSSADSAVASVQASGGLE